MLHATDDPSRLERKAAVEFLDLMLGAVIV
jgi:hypothetical protein